MSEFIKTLHIFQPLIDPLMFKYPTGCTEFKTAFIFILFLIFIYCLSLFFVFVF